MIQHRANATHAAIHAMPADRSADRAAEARIAGSSNGEHADRQALTRAELAVLDGEVGRGRWLFALRGATFAAEEEDGAAIDASTRFGGSPRLAVALSAPYASKGAELAAVLSVADSLDADADADATMAAVAAAGLVGTLIAIG